MIEFSGWIESVLSSAGRTHCPVVWVISNRLLTSDQSIKAGHGQLFSIRDERQESSSSLFQLWVCVVAAGELLQAFFVLFIYIFFHGIRSQVVSVPSSSSSWSVEKVFSEPRQGRAGRKRKSATFHFVFKTSVAESFYRCLLRVEVYLEASGWTVITRWIDRWGGRGGLNESKKDTSANTLIGRAYRKTGCHGN